MPFLTKHHPGSDNFGHVWDDESPVEVTDVEAAELLRIPHAGFELVDAPAVDDSKSRKPADK